MPLSKDGKAAVLALALIPAAVVGCKSTDNQGRVPLDGSTHITVSTNDSTKGAVCAANGVIRVADLGYGQVGQITVVNFGNPLPDTRAVDVYANPSEGLKCESYKTSTTDPAGNLAVATIKVVSEVERATNAPASEPVKLYNIS